VTGLSTEALRAWREAAKVGISKRTAEQAIADAKPKSKVTTIYVTCPECSQRIAEKALDKHLPAEAVTQIDGHGMFNTFMDRIEKQ